MFTKIQDEKLICSYYEQMKHSLIRQLPIKDSKFKKNFEHLKKSFVKGEAYYSNDNSIIYVPQKTLMNAFLSKKHSVVVEMNLHAKDSKAFFASSPSGEIFLFHEGIISGVKKKQFCEWSRYTLTSIDDKEVILIGGINEASFVENVIFFIKNAMEFKQICKNKHQLDSPQKFENLVRKKLLEDIEKQTQQLSRKSCKKKVEVTQYERSDAVKHYALNVANGQCQLCENNGPFKTRHNQYYLEVHHVTWLAKDGLDIPENVIALCPNCHRKMHVIDDSSDVQNLKEQASKLYNIFVHSVRSELHYEQTED
ncbi:HNH endonuclease [Photobacterium damselae]|uniref:HNH endonuclease n=1 Tax=Photobacterium damselae TaxID=38293 RepID=UPI00083B4CEE|nr:HNH endonuclease signature motif containing protein [Photobacterium damselae]ODA26171.1 hypothetical protein A0J46_02055 [Photobacterium damselae subsp. damselae]